MNRKACIIAALVVAFGPACTTGEGEGWIRSEQLYIEDCWNGPFSLNPTFFGANPFREETLIVRIQRGDNSEEVSDGVIVLVNDLQGIREGQLGMAIPVGLPASVEPIGWDPDAAGTSDAGASDGGTTVAPTGPAQVSLALYLHDTCHVQNGTLYSIGGFITFESLFSGDVNEPNADDKLTEANFVAQFADPRDLAAGANDEGRPLISTVEGYFRFFFQRGRPAQPFP